MDAFQEMLIEIHTRSIAIIIIVLSILAACAIGYSVGTEQQRKRIAALCDTNYLFTIPNVEGEFSCYRADLMDAP